MSAVRHSGTGVRQKQDRGNVEALGGLNIFQNEFKVKSFLCLCLGHNEVRRCENRGLLGAVGVDIGPRKRSCDACI